MSDVDMVLARDIQVGDVIQITDQDGDPHEVRVTDCTYNTGPLQMEVHLRLAGTAELPYGLRAPCVYYSRYPSAVDMIPRVRTENQP